MNEAPGYSHPKAGEQQYAPFQAYTQAINRLQIICRHVARLDIDNRLAAIPEAQEESWSP